MSTQSNNNNPSNNEDNKQQRQVVHAEIVEHDEQNDYSRRPFEERTVGYEVHGRGWHQQAIFNQATQRISCLPACITLVLLVSIIWQAGFLAGIGFVFFYILGSILALLVNVRRTLQRKIVYTWLNRIIVWGVTYMLILSLSN